MLRNELLTTGPSYSSTLSDTSDGKDIYQVTLHNDKVTVCVTNLGCTVTAIYTPDRTGVFKNIVAGFSTPGEYKRNPWYFGCIIGRYANRITGGRFTLDGRTVQLSCNHEGNHLHGGFEGFHKKIWEISGVVQNTDEVGVVFRCSSPDGEEGYPGDLEAEVRYVLTKDHRLKMEYSARTNKRTPVNLTNHSYFNLTGFEERDILGHVLNIQADYYTEKGPDNLPTGNLLPLSGSPLDFSSPLPIGCHIHSLPQDRGFDYNYVLRRDVSGANSFHNSPSPVYNSSPAAELSDPASGRVLRVWTDQPGLQLYTANWWDGEFKGAHAQPYVKHGAVALETQAFPDSPNQPEFPDTILDPGETYRANTVLEFGVRE